jgi:ABC-type dipeptide/oligopeptide/nickel transport system permease component
MLKLLLRRIAIAIPTLLVVYTLVFAMAHATPGSPWSASSDRPVPEEVQRNLDKEFNLDKPLVAQYVLYLRGAVQGDFGISYQNRSQTVGEIIAAFLPTSLQLGIAALILAVAVGLPLGALAALRSGGWIDGAISGFTTIGVAMPTYVITSVLIVLLGSLAGLVPTIGWNGIFSSSALVPVIALSMAPMAGVTRYFRSSMLDTLHSDYVRTARAKGVPARRVVIRHMGRNALIPVVTVLGVYASLVLVGSFFVETIAGIPGLGHEFVRSISQRDYPVIMGTTLLFATFVLVMNTIVDLCYMLIDPRIRLGA